MNRCIIEGEIIREPEIRTMTSAKGDYRLWTFTVAVPRKKEGSDYFRCNVWRDLVSKYAGKFHKGQKVHVTGYIGVSAYIGKDEKAHASLELTVEEIDDIPTQQGFVEVETPDDLPF